LHQKQNICIIIGIYDADIPIDEVNKMLISLLQEYQVPISPDAPTVNLPQKSPIRTIKKQRLHIAARKKRFLKI